jgi:signal transduction histidine kinase/CheY-like chemotaxis protein
VPRMSTSAPTAASGSPRTWLRWRDLPLRVKGMFVILLPLLLVVGDCGAVAYLVGRQGQDQAGARRVYQVQRASAELLVLLVDAETGVRGYLAGGQESFLEPYQQANAYLPMVRAELQALRGATGVAARLSRIDALTEQEMSALAELRARPTGSTRLVLLTQGKQNMDALRVELSLIDQQQQAFAAALDRRAGRDRRVALAVAGLSVPLALVGGLLAMLLFTTGVSRRARQVEANAERLGRGEPPGPALVGADELGRLDQALSQASSLLDARSHETAEASRQAQAANEAKSAFLSRMSHDLRTPLNAIIGFGQLLELEATTVDDRESIDQILKAGRHLLELINEVLDLTRIESGHLRLSLEPVAVDEVIAEALDLIAPLAAARPILLDVSDTASGCADYVQADRQRLKQVLLNLLSNAVKYNRPDGTISIHCSHGDGDVLRIEVQDQGSGIRPEHAERLFQPFDRLDAETSDTEGTGLGLALSKQLTDAMGGSIGFDSTPGTGSTFWIELPLTAAVSDPAIDPINERGELHPHRATLLHIEDNLANLRLVERVLAHRPEIRLLPATHGQLGLDLAIEHQPDLILLDVHLPGPDGHEILHSLKQLSETQHIPVIILTADATPGQRSRLLAAGAHACLTKPLNIPDALDLIERAIADKGPNTGG